MGLDVTGCCRLCLAAASSDAAAHVDIRDQPEVDEIIQELYGISLASGGRLASKGICLACYRKVVEVKGRLNGLQSKAKLVTLNQAILGAQSDAFPEPVEDNDDTSPGWSPDSTEPSEVSSKDFVINVEDCMRSVRFQQRFLDKYDLLYLRVSGSIFQKPTGEYADIWYPDQSFCSKCLTAFEKREDFDQHHSACKFRCIYCRRTYVFEETLCRHACPRRNNHLKHKLQQWETFRMVPVPGAKRVRVENGEASVLEPAATDTDLEITGLEIVPAISRPSIDVEANMDVELNTLLERWYGNNEELEELTNLNLEAIEPTGSADSTAINLNLYDTAFQNQVIVPKPAISVKPMSQLVSTPVAQRMAQQAPQPTTVANQSNDVIEIEDDDSSNLRNSFAVPPGRIIQVHKKDQQSLSESDVLNIVKHFRGIDENESYLIKAKINGASKLICVSKRKSETGSPGAAIVNNNATSVSTAKIPQISITQRQAPTAPPASTVVAPTRPITLPASTTIALKTVGSNNPPIPLTATTSVAPRPIRPAPAPTTTNNKPAITNGHPARTSILEEALRQAPSSTVTTMPNVNAKHSTQAPIPQLKIAHVESLVGQTTKPPVQMVLNGQLAPMKPSHVRSPPSVPGILPTLVSPPTARTSMSKTSPRRIIVGSNSMNLLNPPVQRAIATKAPQPTIPTASVNSPPQRIVVKRKHVKTVVQSTIRQTNSVANTGTFRTVTSPSAGGIAVATGPPPLVRRILPQSPGNSAGPQQVQQQQQHQTAYRAIQPKVANIGQQQIPLMSGGAGVRYKMTDTTIRRVE